MQILFNKYPNPVPSAVALGIFDGVHVGHTQLIKAVKRTDFRTVVYTFSTHPVNELSGKNVLKSINTNTEKAEILDSYDIDTIVFDDFNQVKNYSPEEFVEKILIDKLCAREVVCGYNYRFGKNGAGDTRLLSRLLEERGAHLTVIDEVCVDSVAVSSTLIRQALLNGDMETANKLLGRPFFISSNVVHGKALGRTLGFPTINETFESGRLVLPYGVYFAKCQIPDDAQSFLAVVDIGVRPTVNTVDTTPSIEAHLIDFNGDLYGKRVRIELYKKSRDEQKFESLAALKRQISKDIDNCKKYFNEG